MDKRCGFGFLFAARLSLLSARSLLVLLAVQVLLHMPGSLRHQQQQQRRWQWWRWGRAGEEGRRAASVPVVSDVYRADCRR